MKKNTLYHNPRCSKSRQTLALLEDKGVEFEVVDYLKTPPSTHELDQILKALDKPPLEVIRTKEERFKELGLTKSTEKSRDEWLTIMAENPKLIERPIFVSAGKAALGRPPENVLELI